MNQCCATVATVNGLIVCPRPAIGRVLLKSLSGEDEPVPVCQAHSHIILTEPGAAPCPS